MRGFSAPLPKGFATRLGVPPLETAYFPTDLGDQISITRKGVTDAVGRLRSIIDALGLGPGDHIFLREPQRERDPITITAVRADEVDGSAEATAQAAALMGLPDLPDVRTVAEAIGLREDAPISAVADALRGRGEDLLARLVVESFDAPPEESAPGVRDIADLLGL
jgi:hypothetical protein